MNYCVLDVETANPDYGSICQIGFVKVQNSQIADRQSWLINPQCYFDDMNICIHGIDGEKVKNSPIFPEVFEKIHNFLENNIIVHHGPFDRIAITRAIQRYNLISSDIRFLDNQAVVRRAWTDVALKGYGLKNLADRINFEFIHHDALNDALAAQAIFETVLQKSGQDIEWWLNRIKQPLSIEKSVISGTGNPDGQYFGETMVFTGALSAPRAQAAKIAKQAGFNVVETVNENTNILCIGVSDISKFAEGYTKSSKQRKAEKLIEQGYDIKIVFEDNFWEICRLQ